mmetsp:Transcript_90841/g.157580  ORF Transcript_90841/g.157580 Transcript_90841/m.157580 type:complete len:91 (+) Transcript_90841:493-765(+)
MRRLGQRLQTLGLECLFVSGSRRLPTRRFFLVRAKQKGNGQKKATEEVQQTRRGSLPPYHLKVVRTLGSLTLHRPSPAWWSPPKQVGPVC